jgi:hypothetical protein
VVAEHAPLDLGVLATLVAIALVAAVVAEFAAELVAAPRDLDVARWLDPAPWWWRCGGRRARHPRARCWMSPQTDLAWES